MTLAQVQATVAVVLSLMGTWAGLMIAVALLLPTQSSKAERSLEASAKRCFFRGALLIGVFIAGIMLLNVPSPLAKLLGFLAMISVGGVLAVGASGIAQLMGRRISEMSGDRSSFATLVRGSLVFSAAMGFPFIGWMLFAPVSIVCALGAGLAALWPSRRYASPPFNPNPVIEGQGAA